MAGPSDYQMAGPSSYQMEEPRDYQMEDPRDYQMVDPRDYRVAEPRRRQMEDPRDYQMVDPRDYRVAEPRRRQMEDPRDYQMVDPRDYRVAEPRRHQMEDPRDYQMVDPRDYQIADPRRRQMGEPSNNPPSDSRVCPVLHARVSDHEYMNACATAEKLSHGPPIMYYEDHVYYNVKVQEGRLWMKMYGSCAKALNRLEMDLSASAATPGVVRKLIGRGTEEPMEFSINEHQTSSKLHKMLVNSLGVFRRVERDRKLYSSERANIIIDTVKNIGHFVQITVARQPGQTVDEGKSIATFILQSLGVKDQQRIAPFCEYIDLEPWSIHESEKNRQRAER